MDLVDELTAGVRRILAIVGGATSDLGVTEQELVETEERLGRRLPELLRAFYRSAGRHPAMVGRALGARFIPPGELDVTQGAVTFLRAPGGQEYALLSASSASDEKIRERSGRQERITPVPLSSILMEAALMLGIAALPHAYAGHSNVKPTDFEPLDARKQRYCDPALRVLLSRRTYDTAVTVGAASRDVIAEVERRLRTKLVPLRIAGKRVEPKTTPRVALPAVAPKITDRGFRAALATILRVRHGRAKMPTRPGPWLAKVERQLRTKLPSFLVTFHAFVQSDEKLLQVDRNLVPPAELAVADSIMKIGEENQGVVQWGVKRKDLALADPPVFQFGRSTKKGTLISPRLSAFLVQTAAWQTVFGMGAITEVRVAPEELDDAVRKIEAVFTKVAAGRFSMPTQECYIATGKRAVAVVLRDSDSARAFFGGTQKTLEAVEKKVDLPFEWL